MTSTPHRYCFARAEPLQECVTLLHIVHICQQQDIPWWPWTQNKKGT